MAQSLYKKRNPEGRGLRACKKIAYEGRRVMIKNKKMLLAGGCLLLLGAVALAFFLFYGRREERGEDFSRESLSENAR